MKEVSDVAKERKIMGHQNYNVLKDTIAVLPRILRGQQQVPDHLFLV